MAKKPTQAARDLLACLASGAELHEVSGTFWLSIRGQTGVNAVGTKEAQSLIDLGLVMNKGPGRFVISEAGRKSC